MYASYEENFSILSDEDKGKLITAIFTYNRTRETPVLTGMVKMAFSFIKTNLDRDYAKWESTKEARREAGKKDGAASLDLKSDLSNFLPHVEQKVHRIISLLPYTGSKKEPAGSLNIYLRLVSFHEIEEKFDFSFLQKNSLRLPLNLQEPFCC
jgi:hypothetical protein